LGTVCPDGLGVERLRDLVCDFGAITNLLHGGQTPRNKRLYSIVIDVGAAMCESRVLAGVLVTTMGLGSEWLLTWQHLGIPVWVAPRSGVV
jgi:hypothetical protein